VPALLVHPSGQCLDHVDRRDPADAEVEADAADAQPIQALQLGIGHAWIDHSNAARDGSELGDRREGTAVFGAIGGGRDDDGAGEAQTLL